MSKFTQVTLSGPRVQIAKTRSHSLSCALAGIVSEMPFGICAGCNKCIIWSATCVCMLRGVCSCVDASKPCKGAQRHASKKAQGVNCSISGNKGTTRGCSLAVRKFTKHKVINVNASHWHTQRLPDRRKAVCAAPTRLFFANTIVLGTVHVEAWRRNTKQALHAWSCFAPTKDDLHSIVCFTVS